MEAAPTARRAGSIADSRKWRPNKILDKFTSMRIGITQSDSKYHLYVPWIKGIVLDGIEVVDLSYSRNNFEDVKDCDGVLISGGDDSHPRFYNNDRVDYPNAPNTFNEKRDEFETKLMDYIMEHEVPVLGICRGMQFINCHLGGDMIQDLEEDGMEDHRAPEGTNRLHAVKVDKESQLHQLVNATKGLVNTSHHQGVGAIPTVLKPVAYSEDGVVEAIEFADQKKEHFLMGVQWHPEWMKPDEMNPFGYRIRDGFIQAVQLYELGK